jgi:DNA-binding response OmpR family regulator
VKKGGDVQHKTILIAEEQGPDQQVLTSMVEKLGFKYILCDDGQEALLVLKKQHAHIDGVLLDVILPSIDGISVLGHCKAHYITLPVIIICSEDDHADRDHIMSIGADGFVTKPFDPAQLEAAIQMALSGIPEEKRSRSTNI